MALALTAHFRQQISKPRIAARRRRPVDMQNRRTVMLQILCEPFQPHIDDFKGGLQK